MIAFSPSHFPFPLPEKHRFPTQKYSLLKQALLEHGWDIVEAQKATWPQILAVHDADYVDAWRAGKLDQQQIRALGFPWSIELLNRSLASVGGTIQATAQALKSGFSANLAGGTHHSFADRGEGFCVFNDVVVAAVHFQFRGQIHRATVVDLDVHQGNGTAKMAQQYSWLKTVSVHGAKNYPFQKELSDLDVPLEDGLRGNQYLQAINDHVLPFLNQTKPEIVFLNAGADVLSGDRYGRLELSIDDIATRDLLIAQFCRANKTPMVWVMGGGYHPEITQTVAAHFHSLQAIRKLLES